MKVPTRMRVDELWTSSSISLRGNNENDDGGVATISIATTTAVFDRGATIFGGTIFDDGMTIFNEQQRLMEV